jgi:hypothetical protein
LASNPSLVSARPMSILLTVQPLKISTFLFQLGHPNMIKRSSTLMYRM